MGRDRLSIPEPKPQPDKPTDPTASERLGRAYIAFGATFFLVGVFPGSIIILGVVNHLWPMSNMQGCGMCIFSIPVALLVSPIVALIAFFWPTSSVPK